MAGLGILFEGRTKQTDITKPPVYAAANLPQRAGWKITPRVGVGVPILLPRSFADCQHSRGRVGFFVDLMTPTRSLALFALYELTRTEPPRRVVAVGPRGTFMADEVARVYRLGDQGARLDDGATTKALGWLCDQKFARLVRNNHYRIRRIYRITDLGKQTVESQDFLAEHAEHLRAHLIRVEERHFCRLLERAHVG